MPWRTLWKWAVTGWLHARQPALKTVRVYSYTHASCDESASPPHAPAAGYRLGVRAMPTSIHEELRHRGESLVAYPGADFWKLVGGSDGVAALIEDLYRRIEQDELLRVA